MSDQPFDPMESMQRISQAMQFRYYDRQGQEISMVQWVLAFQDFERHCRVAETFVGDIRVSTVWLGLDHRHDHPGPPLIFETMVFGGPLDQEPYRWTTEEEALSGHEIAVTAVRLMTDDNKEKDE